MRYSLEVYTAPTIEPVTLTEAKNHCRIDGNADDTMLSSLITAARKYCETTVCRRAFIEQTLVLRCDTIPEEFRMPRPPLVSVTSIKYYDGSGVQQTLSASTYTVDKYSRVGKIVQAYGASWPVCRGHTNDVEVTYKAGYGATAATVPEMIRQAILMLVEHWYKHRGPVVTGTIVADLPKTVDALLADYRIADEF